MSQTAPEAKHYSEVTVTLGGQQFSARLGDVHPFHHLFAFQNYTPALEHLKRLRDGTWTADLVLSIVRSGLIGAGRYVHDADEIMRDNVRSRPVIEALPAAMRILGAYLVGDLAPDEEGE